MVRGQQREVSPILSERVVRLIDLWMRRPGHRMGWQELDPGAHKVSRLSGTRQNCQPHRAHSSGYAPSYDSGTTQYFASTVYFASTFRNLLAPAGVETLPDRMSSGLTARP